MEPKEWGQLQKIWLKSTTRSRESQDQFALWSQQKVFKSQEAGFFDDEICSIEIPQRKKIRLYFQKMSSTDPILQLRVWLS